MKVLKFLGNILWFLVTGLETALMNFVLGLIWCITIIGIPFGLQIWKMAKLSLWPFGRVVEKEKGHPILNIIWFIFGGFSVFFFYLLVGIIWCITIVGIPFGKQCFKMAGLSAHPFGRVIKKA